MDIINKRLWRNEEYNLYIMYSVVSIFINKDEQHEEILNNLIRNKVLRYLFYLVGFNV